MRDPFPWTLLPVRRSTATPCRVRVAVAIGTVGSLSSTPFTNSPTLAERPERTPVPIEVRHVVYSTALDLLSLREEALDDLIGRGLSPETIDLAIYKSIPRRGTEYRNFIARLIENLGEESLRKCPGLTDKNGRLAFWTASGTRDGYVVPYRDASGFITGLQQKVLGGKYLTARGSVLSSVYHLSGRGGPGQDLYVTEGASKATVASHLGGIWTFAVAGQPLTPQHIDVIRRLRPRRVLVALDQEDNPNTDRARERWCRSLWEHGLPVFTAVWEGEDLGGAKGLDDILLHGRYPRIRRVSQAPSELGRARRPQTTSNPGPIDAGQSLEEVRQVVGRSVKDFLGHPHSNQGQSLLISTSPGSGKTTAVAKTLRESGRIARILVGTKNLAAELADEHGYTLIEGRSEQNCERFDVVEALRDGGHKIGKFACGTPSEPRCPQRGNCPYWNQYQSLGTWVAAAELLFNPLYLEHGEGLVVDDADLSRTLVERLHLDSDTLERAVEQLRGKGWSSVRQILAVVSHALVDSPRYENGPGGKALLGPAVWDHLIRTACRYGLDLPELIGALPEDLRFPNPKAKSKTGLTVDEVKSVPSMAVRRLLEVLIVELSSFAAAEDFNSRIRLNTAGINIWNLRALPTKDAKGKDPSRMPLLVLDATPVQVLTDHLASRHSRLPEITASIRIPGNVTVVQYAASSNGHAVLSDPRHRQRVGKQVAVERDTHPVTSPDKEAVICFRSQREAMEELGFPPSQVLTFGSARGSNALANVERLHVIGRPMPPSDDLIYLAQVLHHGDEDPVSNQIELRRRNTAARGARWAWWTLSIPGSQRYCTPDVKTNFSRYYTAPG